ncbi:MAG TPA: hydrogenase [Verrucomicrobiae bacterium]|nr:hydrogenase [Verrucomicrobiae bacterium]
MDSVSEQLLVLVMLLNFVVLGTSRLKVAIRAVATQGVMLGLLPGLLHAGSLHLWLMCTGLIAAKGMVIPYMLNDALRKVRVVREAQPLVGYLAVQILGGIGTAAAFTFAARLPLAPEHRGLLLVPASLATLAAGFLLLITRRKALSQVVGYLVLENGIFIFGLLLTSAMPALVEAGVLLDMIVGIFVMGIIINQIGREFSSLDTSRLTSLKE